MAKTAIIRIPSPRFVRARSMARHYGGRALAAARSEKHTITAVAAAAGLGLLKRTGVELPRIDALGTAGTYGIAAWLLARQTHSNVLAHVATGLLCVAAHSLAAGGGVAGDDDMAGEVD